MIRRTVCFTPGFYLMFAVSLLLVPMRWIIAWIAAALIHELAHILAIKLCGCKIYNIKLGAGGAKIDVQLSKGVKTVICALAGPLGGLLLLLAYRIAPRTALCALFQSLFNLIPLYPMDGGRALSGLICAIAGERYVFRIIPTVEKIVRFLLLVLSVYVTFVWHLGLVPVLVCMILLLRNKNIPCKRSPYRVQYL